MCDTRFRVSLWRLDMRPWVQDLGGGITLENMDM